MKMLSVTSLLALCLLPVACKKQDEGDGAPPPAQVVETGDNATVTVDDPSRFELATAERIDSPERLDLTGSVTPDVTREIPVISLASGRVVELDAKLDDFVKKGQLLMRVQSPDVTNAYDAYLKAKNDESVADKAYLRAKDLYEHGAISQGMLEQAEGTENDAKADLNSAAGQLDTLGVKPGHPSNVVDVTSPITGVIVAQNVTNAAAAGVTYSGNATAFTVADLSRVWVLCDVYENQMEQIKVGQAASIKLAAYPDKVLTGVVSDVGPVLDPTLRTAKVRIEVANPGGMLKVGMFVTATVTSRETKQYAVVPSAAILHIHDRDWVFVPRGKQFQRVEVTAGDTLAGKRQQVLSGIQPGQQVVADVLQMEALLEAQ
jgi:cobalt-zinc-cadmium efflux system membrane fusion protein